MAVVFSICFTEVFFCILVLNVEQYEVDVYKEYIVLGNDAFLKCRVPDYLGDFLTPLSWEESSSWNVYYRNNLGNCCMVYCSTVHMYCSMTSTNVLYCL